MVMLPPHSAWLMDQTQDVIQAVLVASAAGMLMCCIVQEACHWLCHPHCGYLDITSLENSYARQVARQAGSDLGQSSSISRPVDMSLSLSCSSPSPSLSLPFHLCVSVCACLCVSVCRLQTDQLSAWAHYQAAGRSTSHMWRTEQEAG